MTSNDLTGRRFGKLTVMERTDQKQERYVVWRCQCDCGNDVYVNTKRLKRGTKKNCGCETKTDAKRGPVAEDLSGCRYGTLLVMYRAETLNGRTRWMCQCDCGNRKIIATRELKAGKTKSCGCQQHRKGRYLTDIKGHRFGRLTALYPTDKRDKKSSIYWVCRCDCETELEITEDRLVHGTYRSCGCLKRENQQTIFEKLHMVDGTCVEWLEKRKYRSDNTSGFRGVYSMKNGRYRCAIGFKGQRFHIGTYDTYEEAVEARMHAEDLLHDGFVRAYYDWRELAGKDPEWAAANPFVYEVEKKGEEFIVRTNIK